MERIITISEASPEQANDIAPLIYSSGPRSLQAIFHTRAQPDPVDFLTMAFALPCGQFSYKYHLVGSQNKRLVACACYWPDLRNEGAQKATLASLIDFYGAHALPEIISRSQELSRLVPPVASHSLAVGHIAVSPTFQHQGIASTLLRELSRLGRDLNKTALELDVECSNNNAVSLYQKHGFDIVSKSVPTTRGAQIGLEAHYHMRLLQ